MARNHGTWLFLPFGAVSVKLNHSTLRFMQLSSGDSCRTRSSTTQTARPLYCYKKFWLWERRADHRTKLRFCGGLAVILSKQFVLILAYICSPYHRSLIRLTFLVFSPFPNLFGGPAGDSITLDWMEDTAAFWMFSFTFFHSFGIFILLNSH